MAHVLLKTRSGAAITPIDFKGSAQSISAVLGGQLKPLGVTSLKSSRLLPNVKSIAEQGVSGYELVGWTVVFAPRGIPAEVSQTLSTAIGQILITPEVQSKLLQLGMDPQFKSVNELRSFVTNEKDKWGRLIGATKL
jgi:tripartite-type tricarboxylate transporter receptor subunit TctC